MKRNLINIKKLIALIVIFISLLFTMFLYYRLYIEISYSTDYKTIGTVTKMDLEEEDSDEYKWILEIKYEDSRRNKVKDKYLIYEESDEYKKLEKHNVKVGNEIEILTEECFAEGFLGKRVLLSTILSILEN